MFLQKAFDEGEDQTRVTLTAGGSFFTELFLSRLLTLTPPLTQLVFLHMQHRSIFSRLFPLQLQTCFPFSHLHPHPSVHTFLCFQISWAKILRCSDSHSDDGDLRVHEDKLRERLFPLSLTQEQTWMRCDAGLVCCHGNAALQAFWSGEVLQAVTATGLSVWSEF